LEHKFDNQSVCLHAAIAEAERVTGLDDLRDDRGLMDIADPDEFVLGQVLAPIAVVTDPCFRGGIYAEVFRGEDPLLRHVRTRVRSPQTKPRVAYCTSSG